MVIIGAGHAGVQLADILRSKGCTDRISLVSAEPELPYERPPLSKGFLSPRSHAELSLLRQPSFYAAREIDLLRGSPAVSLDRKGRRVLLEDGTSLPYDALVFATGGRVIRPDVPGSKSLGVFELKTVHDATALRDRIRSGGHAVVVGAGFIGLEFAAAALSAGLRVTIVSQSATPLSRLLSPLTSQFFAERFREKGAEFRFGVTTQEILQRLGRTTGVRLAGGEVIPADFVVIGTGITPNVQLASESGLTIDNGIAVDRTLRTTDPRIFALGDCASLPSHAAGHRVRIESIPNAVDQARYLASRIQLPIEEDATPFSTVPWFWSQLGPYKLHVAGLSHANDHTVVRGDLAAGAGSIFSFRNGTLTAVESVNRLQDHLAARRILALGLPLTTECAVDNNFDLRAFAKTGTV